MPPRVLHIGQTRPIRITTYWTFLLPKLLATYIALLIISWTYLTISATSLTRAEPPKLFSTLTDHIKIHHIKNEKIDLQIKLKIIPDIDEAVKNLTILIQQAAWTSTKSDKTNSSIKNNANSNYFLVPE